MIEYGNVVTVLSDGVTPEPFKVAAAKDMLHRSFLVAAQEYGFPEDAVYEMKSAPARPSYTVYRHDGGEVDFDDPALAEYYSGERDLPAEYYVKQTGWRHDFGWYYAADIS